MPTMPRSGASGQWLNVGPVQRTLRDVRNTRYTAPTPWLLSENPSVFVGHLLSPLVVLQQCCFPPDSSGRGQAWHACLPGPSPRGAHRCSSAEGGCSLVSIPTAAFQKRNMRRCGRKLGKIKITENVVKTERSVHLSAAHPDDQPNGRDICRRTPDHSWLTQNECKSGPVCMMTGSVSSTFVVNMIVDGVMMIPSLFVHPNNGVISVLLIGASDEKHENRTKPSPGEKSPGVVVSSVPCCCILHDLKRIHTSKWVFTALWHRNITDKDTCSTRHTND